jgi:hypothetical protein
MKIARNGLSRMPPQTAISRMASGQRRVSSLHSSLRLHDNSLFVLRIPMMADQYDMKLAQAEHHVSLMRQYANDEDCRPFNRELRAFLGAARSVAQYVLESAQTQGPVAVQEYATDCETRRALRFLRDARNADVHAFPYEATPVVEIIYLHVLPSPRTSSEAQLTDENSY